MSYLEESLAKLKEFEGSVTWMYRDTVGLITVGVGNMLPNVEAALKLPFRVQSSGDLAGEPAVRKEFARVGALAAGKLPKFYYEYEALTLADTDIDALLAARVAVFETQLRRQYPHYGSFPDAVKLGLIDMIYNLGAGKLVNTYPHFDNAVFDQNWNTAANLCHRNGPSEARNDWTRNQFVSAGGMANG
jgi:GH24 family phage-related lysozyme (muramidase)